MAEAPTANEQLMDALVRHQVGLMRLTGSLQRRVLALLDASEEDLRARVMAAVDPLTSPSGAVPSLARIQAIRKQVVGIRSAAWKRAMSELVAEVNAVTQQEARFTAGAMATASPTTILPAVPARADLLALVTQSPMQGRVLREWADGLQANDVNRIMDQVRIGMVQGETVPEIARRVVGTGRLRGVDGVTEISRREATAITRTAVNHFANAAKAITYAANSDVLSGEMYLATLDARTTAVCRSLDGKIYEVGVGPRPPLHFNCRSLRVPVLDGQVLGSRPAKASTEQGLLREFSEQRGLDRVPRTRKALPRGTKGAYDDFARGRVRELTGRVPAATSYGEWLRRQSAAFQDDVLGKTKGALFRRGNLPLDRFVDPGGREYSLSELARTDRGAFEAAGLDPHEFV